MKAKGFSTAAALSGLLFFASTASGDIIERQFVQKDTGKVTTGAVLQGSKNMRHLGRRTSSRSSIQVLSPIHAVPGFTVTPAAEPEVSPPAPKPRFGYGAEEPSDGRTTVERPSGPAEPEPPTDPRAKAGSAPVSGPVYQFRYSYPVHREYYYGTPFFGYSPFSYRCYGRHFHSYGSSFSRRHYSVRGHGWSGGLSFFFGW